MESRALPLLRTALALALCALAGLHSASAQQAPAGSGHFRFAAIHWEKQEGAAVGPYAVNFVIRSSWRASYVGFHLGSVTLPLATSAPLMVLGTTTPSFTIVAETANVTHSVLLNVTGQSAHPYSMGGDWVEGETVIPHTFSTKGPHRAVFAGCCRINMISGAGHFEQEVSIDFGRADFSPQVPVVPGAFLSPGNAVSFPAVHPKGMLGPKVVAGSVAIYKWRVLQTVNLASGHTIANALPAGVTMNVATGMLQVAAQGAAHGMYQVEVDVSVNGTDSASSVIQLLNISNTVPLTPTLGAAMPSESASPLFPGSGAVDQLIRFRTGFKVEAMVPFSASAPNSTLSLHSAARLPAGMTNTVDTDPLTGHKRIKLSWDKPCWHQGMARQLAACFVVTETSTAGGVAPMGFYAATAYMRRSTPMCLHLRVDEDESPKFSEPVAEHTFYWEMGRGSEFMIKVRDEALLDTVAKVDVAAATPLATGMVLSPAILTGNTAQRKLSWEPLPSSGGGEYRLCFETEDTPGLSYEKCRLGVRTASVCVTVVVARCRYILRPREALSDVAAHFHTDWVQLWALNPQLTRPDEQVGFKANSTQLGAAVNTGHLYRVDRGDYLAAVAYKFGTSVKMLLHTNADLITHKLEDKLEIGKRLCIIPNSCLRD
jgi:hypothetical protein